MTVEIPLSRGLVALVDDKDAAAVLAAGKWSATRSPSNRTWYAIRAFRDAHHQRRMVRLHRFLTGWQRVDHRNGDGLDCRRENLRPATHAENARNTARRVDSTSGYKGVSWAAHTGRWRALISVDGRRTHLGYYADPIAAARAYDVAALELHGEFAALNFSGKDRP